MRTRSSKWNVFILVWSVRPAAHRVQCHPSATNLPQQARTANSSGQNRQRVLHRLPLCLEGPPLHSPLTTDFPKQYPAFALGRSRVNIGLLKECQRSHRGVALLATTLSCKLRLIRSTRSYHEVSINGSCKSRVVIGNHSFPIIIPIPYFS